MVFLLLGDSVYSKVETSDSTEVLVETSNPNSILFLQDRNISESLWKILSYVE